MLLWPFNKYPGTDYETFNWEWILKTVKDWVATMQTFKDSITAAWNAMRADWSDFETSMTDDWQNYQDGLNDDWQNYQDGLNDQWQEFVDDTYKDQITEILEQHPEWVTTVMDGAITFQKLNGEIRLCVTPEMYGAIGNGVHDDTAAFNQAIAAGNNMGLPVYCADKTYIITSIIKPKNLYCAGTIKYTGADDHAIEINDSYNMINIHTLKSATGGVCFKPSGFSDTSVNCSYNTINIIDVVALNGTALKFDCTDGCCQFNNIDIKNIRGQWNEHISYGVVIRTYDNAEKYCNANKINIENMAFMHTGIYCRSVDGACIDNRIGAVHFEQCENAIDEVYFGGEIICDLFEDSSGTININQHSIGTYTLYHAMKIGKLNIISDDCMVTINGDIANNTGSWIANKLYISNCGIVAPNTFGMPSTSVGNRIVYGNGEATYLHDGDTFLVPTIRMAKSSAQSRLQKYIINFSAAALGTITVTAYNGESKTLTYTKTKGVIVVLPSPSGNSFDIYEL